ncbi:MAG: ABC transporter permease [Lachnospiraceae bacterium]|nr:ABC transporter permease [Lachnospiraceae bacterium]
MVFKQHSLLKKIIKRLLLLVVYIFILSVVVFVLARLAPGDPLQSFYGDAVDTMTQEQLDAARARLGLDQSIAVQYVRWICNAFHGDFGISLKYKMPAQQVISPLIGNTLVLGVLAYVIVFALAVVLAVVCALHEDDFLDRAICKIGTAAYYIPGFWLGVVLVLIFSINLGWFPSSGAYDVGKAGDIGNRIRHLVLPLIVMVASHLWYYAYMIRNKLLDELRKDYVLLAKGKGLTRSQIVWKHCLRNVAPTIVSIMAISVPHITGGTVVVENVFAYPGIGNLAVESAKYHDYNLLMLSVLITGALVFFSSFVAQLVNEQIDPRMKEVGTIQW